MIGLTATPDKRTFAFFNENVVSEYPREQAIVDGVNVGEDIFRRGLCLPSDNKMTPEEQDIVIAIVRSCFQ